MEKKSIAALIVTGAMVFGLSACGTNGATSDNADNSQDTSTPAVTEPVDTSNFVSEETTSNTSSSTEEEVEETLGIELPPVEVAYIRDYDTDKNGTISKDEWEKWCADHPEDTNKNMIIEDSEQPQVEIPGDTSGNPDSGSTSSGGGTTTSKPSTGGGTSSGGSTSGGQTSKPSTGGNTSSGGSTSGGNTSGGSTSGGNTSSGTVDPEEVPDWATGGSTSNSVDNESELIENIEAAGGEFDTETGMVWVPNIVP